ncbi:hypothetical protein [Paraburkholderia sp. J12]|uniref:hypothetical protein n=1 Tax=Paraburkholderia sp. J12 TaxID=2805432 RepID=UPI002ABD7C9D|nr:hypothetical protein [Paraburkholderia sp. J12]
MNIAFLVIAGRFHPSYPHLTKVRWIKYDFETRDRLSDAEDVDVSEVIEAIEHDYRVEIGFPTNDGKYVQGQLLTVVDGDDGEKRVVPSISAVPGYNFSDLPPLNA